jgi:Glycine zipper 2TM domain
MTMRKITLALAAAAMAVPATLTVPMSAQAQGRYYSRDGYYNGPTWRGRDGRYRCRRSDGTTGLVIGGVAGAVLGNQIAGRGSHGLGTVIGGVAGALAGREVDRSDSGRRDRNGQRCR